MSQISHAKLNSVVEKQTSAPSLSPTTTTVDKVIEETKVDKVDATDLEGATSLDDSPDKGKKKNRCFICRKKLGLTGE